MRRLYRVALKKTGPPSHCKYSEIPWPNCVKIGELLQYLQLNTVINFLLKNFIALWRHLAKTQLLSEYLQWDRVAPFFAPPCMLHPSYWFWILPCACWIRAHFSATPLLAYRLHNKPSSELNIRINSRANSWRLISWSLEITTMQ